MSAFVQRCFLQLPLALWSNKTKASNLVLSADWEMLKTGLKTDGLSISSLSDPFRHIVTWILS